jgi:arsenate reductase
MTDSPISITIYHNPACGTSRNVLINRPIVVTPWGAKLCRPSETLLDILPLPQKGAFKREDGELLIDARGQRVITSGGV